MGAAQGGTVSMGAGDGVVGRVGMSGAEAAMAGTMRAEVWPMVNAGGHCHLGTHTGESGG